MHHNASWVLSACAHGDSACFSAFQGALLDKMLDRPFVKLRTVSRLSTSNKGGRLSIENPVCKGVIEV